MSDNLDFTFQCFFVNLFHTDYALHRYKLVVVAQLIERLLSTPEDPGSSPVVDHLCSLHRVSIFQSDYFNMILYLNIVTFFSNGVGPMHCFKGNFHQSHPDLIPVDIIDFSYANYKGLNRAKYRCS